MRTDRVSAFLLAAIACFPTAGQAAGITELHYQYGVLRNTAFQGGGSVPTHTFTLQHASTWKYGDFFFFIDQRNFRRGGSDLYAEGYAGLSLSKLTGKRIGFGPIRDIGPRMAINWGADPNIRKYLPGWRVAWDVPGFRFLNTDFYAFIDDSGGLASGGAPKQTDAWQASINWAAPFAIASQRFSIEGYFEYTGERRNELGGRVARSVIGQPQFRFDLGHALWGQQDKIFIGVEWLIWVNKLGDPATNESRIQGLLVWRF